MVRLARRITETTPKSYGMFAKAAALGDRVDLIHLELGQPIHDTPTHVKDAAISALRAGHVHYSDFQGLAELRHALADKMASENKITVGPEGVLVTNGLTSGAFAAFMAVLDKDDEAILLDPYYPQHYGKIEMAGARPILAQLDGSANFSINRELIAKHVTPRTRAIVLVNPCNPTGRCYTRDELQIVADLAQEHDLVVVSDEVYERVTFDAEHLSIASLPGMRERTITLFAFTKAFAMDGWRLGWLAADPALMPSLIKVTTTAVTHVNTFVQYGGVAAVTGPEQALQEMVDADRRNRDLVVSRLNQMQGVSCVSPEGTIYAFPDIRATGLSSPQAADTLLNETGVVVESGAFYGSMGEGHLRICFGSQPYEKIEEAMDRLAIFFNEERTNR